jgi:glucan 1,3-beta-glucosidase
MATLSALALFITWNFLLLFWPDLVTAAPRPQAPTFANVTTSNTMNPLALSSQYWVASIKRQGTVPFSSNSGNYAVYRNVKDFGAKGK